MQTVKGGWRHGSLAPRSKPFRMDAFMKVRGSLGRSHSKFGVESMVSRRMYSVGVDKLESVASPSIILPLKSMALMNLEIA